MFSQTKADRQDNTEVEIARCSRGHYFGELALVTNKPRAASAYAIGGVKCLGKFLWVRLTYIFALKCAPCAPTMSPDWCLCFSDRHTSLRAFTGALQRDHEEEYCPLWGAAGGSVWIQCGPEGLRQTGRALHIHTHTLYNTTHGLYTPKTFCRHTFLFMCTHSSANTLTLSNHTSHTHTHTCLMSLRQLLSTK